MAYITNADIEERLGSSTYVQLTDDDGDGNADTGVVDEARLGAEGEVDSYLARRFAVPIDLSAYPELADLLATKTLDLVEFRLYARRPPLPGAVQRKHDDAVAWLLGVANGSIALPASESVAPNPALGPIGRAFGEDRLLSREELSDH